VLKRALITKERKKLLEFRLSFESFELLNLKRLIMKNLLIIISLLGLEIGVFAQNEALRPVKKTTHLGVYWGYENESGEVVIPAKYKQAYNFENGVARIKGENDLFGLIDEKGNEILPPEYVEIDPFEDPGYGDVESISYNASVVRKKIRTEESKNRHKYYQSFSAPLPGTKRKDFIYLEGVVNTSGDFIVPLAEHNVERRYGLFFLSFPKDKYQNFNAVVNQEGSVVIPPVLAQIDLSPFIIVLRYNKALSINGSDYKYDVAEMYDREGNLLINVDEGYRSISSWDGNPRFFMVRRDFYNPEYSQKAGLVDAKGNEVLPTFYSWVDWRYKTSLYKVSIENTTQTREEVYFMVDESMTCVEMPEAPCPEPLDPSFDYEAFLGVRKIKPDFKETSSLPWENNSMGTSIVEVQHNEKPTNSEATAGVGPVYSELNTKWIEYPAQALGGHVMMIEDIQVNTQCGHYERITSNSGGIEIEAKASLHCIHADESGFIFELNYLYKPDWYQYNPGKRYLHIIKIEKKGKVKYKYQIMIGEYDKTFEKGKLGYQRIRPFDSLNGSGWWDIAFKDL